MNPVFITGGTGYLGRPLVATLIARGYPVHALVRAGSEAKLPPGAGPVLGNALEAASFVDAIPPGSTIVHLVGTPHPSPAKAPEFRRVDLASILRPWYVLGPGHRWPYVLLPFYALMRALPATREGARRLGLVSRRSMVAALVRAVEAAPAEGVRVVEVPEIRTVALAGREAGP